MLTAEQKSALIRAANDVRRHAYAPYSHYPVGAAILTHTGTTFTGINVENAAYPATICAERVAVFKMISEGFRDMAAIAVVTRNGGTPCGACRQVLSEFGRETEVIIANEAGEIQMETSLSQLLPFSFGPGDLA
jgi:cytidine deaminase